jgi:hypothetical protein
MNIVDSSGWLEYFAEGKMSNFTDAIEDAAHLLVPVICICEVFAPDPVTRLERAQTHIRYAHWAS